MHCMRSLRSSLSLITSLPCHSLIKTPMRNFRKPSPCGFYPPDKKSCFNISNVTIELGNQCNSKMIRSFLYSQFWPREPTICALWMALDCPYLEILTDKYSNSGDRFLAFERLERTNEQKLIGVLAANKVFPWMVDDLEDWAHNTASRPERHRMYFSAHCLKSPNLFKKFNVGYIYDIEVIATAAEVTGQGVATMLLRKALDNASELRYPLVQVVAVSQYMDILHTRPPDPKISRACTMGTSCKVCERCGMKRAWAMDYTDFVDLSGQRVFFPRKPHQTVAIYIKHFDPKIGGIEPCKPPY